MGENANKELLKIFNEAVRTDEAEVVEKMISSGLDANETFGYDTSPLLHNAIEWEAVKIAELLIRSGADIHQMIGGLTPLNHAIDTEADCAWQKGRIPIPNISKLLLDMGANPLVEDGFGKNAIAFANDYDYGAFLNLLAPKK